MCLHQLLGAVFLHVALFLANEAFSLDAATLRACVLLLLNIFPSGPLPLGVLPSAVALALVVFLVFGALLNKCNGACPVLQVVKSNVGIGVDLGAVFLKVVVEFLEESPLPEVFFHLCVHRISCKSSDEFLKIFSLLEKQPIKLAFGLISSVVVYKHFAKEFN